MIFLFSTLSHLTDSLSFPQANVTINNARRRLQFEGMFDVAANNPKRRGKKGGGGGGEGKGGGGGGKMKGGGRSQALQKAVEDIILNMDRYHLWWTGPPDSDVFKPTHTASEPEIGDGSGLTVTTVVMIHPVGKV